LALLDGTKYGRNGLGSIYVMASGNGGIYDDICTLDGYANSIYTISIGSIDESSKAPEYSEVCAAQLAVTFGGSLSVGISTTDYIPVANRISDVNQRCTTRHYGTSAAAPFASGLIALLLQQR
jgi:subtilisin family serine protease